MIEMPDNKWATGSAGPPAWWRSDDPCPYYILGFQRQTKNHKRPRRGVVRVGGRGGEVQATVEAQRAQLVAATAPDPSLLARIEALEKQLVATEAAHAAELRRAQVWTWR